MDIILTLLDWCSANGIRIHPNLRILHQGRDKKGIYVCAADAPILPEQSRKPGSLFTLALPYLQPSAIFAPGLALLTTSVMYLSSSFVDVSCRNPEIRRAVRPFVRIGRPHPPRTVRSRCHPYPRLGIVFRTVRPTNLQI